MKKLILIITLILSFTTYAELKLPSIFSDGMVLQRNKDVTIWGITEPLSKVQLFFAEQVYEVKSNKDGKFSIKLDKMNATSTPLEMKIISNEKTIILNNILIGEVWLCSGQSNMQWPVMRNFDHPANYHQIKLSCSNPLIRMFTVKQSFSELPREDCDGKWNLTLPETIGDFSAVAYFFGKELFNELNIPIGLIHSSWGGTSIEAWTPMISLEKFPSVTKNIEDRYKQALTFNEEENNKKNIQAEEDWKRKLKEAKANGLRPPRRTRWWKHHPVKSQHFPSSLYNAMINPIHPYSMKGAIWYQGENNAKSIESALLYKDLLENLTTSWRSKWNDDFSFYAVQLVNFMPSVDQPIQDSAWAHIRQSFLDFHKDINRASIVVGIDTGDALDIHPNNKHIIGYRLAQRALVDDYGFNRSPGGPIYKNMKIDGEKIILNFEDIGAGLVSRYNEPLNWFAIAGSDKKFVKATAIIKGKTIEVFSEEIKNPKAVRYAWANNPEGCNLFNRDGFPASPFKTDDWK